MKIITCELNSGKSALLGKGLDKISELRGEGPSAGEMMLAADIIFSLSLMAV